LRVLNFGFRRYLNLRFQRDLEEKITKPLSPEAKTDALKMKELTERFRFADFHVTDPTKGLYYKVEFDDEGMDKCPMIYYYDEDGRSYPFFSFPRPLQD
jgi:3-polyprenyl-4-hydroxybenzoate decarboxylase